MTRNPKPTTNSDKALSAADVKAYLEANPDFLAKNPQLIDTLTPPQVDHGKGVVDFQHFMLQRLKGETHKAEKQREVILAASRMNESIRTRVHTAVIRMLDCASFEEFIEAVTAELPLYLDVDVCTLIVEAEGAMQEVPGAYSAGIQIVPEGTLNAIMGADHVVLSASQDISAELFGAGAGLVKSQALLKLFISAETPMGALAFGSRDPDGFVAGQGTELVSFLAAVVERLIRKWLELPAV